MMTSTTIWSMGIATIFHALSAIIWVGGMFFAYLILRPVAGQHLEPPIRLTLWRNVFQKFFLWVWHSIAFLWLSGLWMIYLKQGFANVGWHVHAMMGLGSLMTLIFIYLVFIPYNKLIQAVQQEDWQTGANALAQIRIIVAINLLLGFLTSGLGAAGVYFVF